MGTLLRSENPTDSLTFQECLERLGAKGTHNSELNIYDVDVQLFLSQCVKLQGIWSIESHKTHRDNPEPEVSHIHTKQLKYKIESSV